MQVTLNSRTQQLVESLVSRGAFESPEAVIEAAIGQMALDDPRYRLDPATIQKVLRAYEQCERGEARDLADVARELESRYTNAQD